MSFKFEKLLLLLSQLFQHYLRSYFLVLIVQGYVKNEHHTYKKTNSIERCYLALNIHSSIEKSIKARCNNRGIKIDSKNLSHLGFADYIVIVGNSQKELQEMLDEFHKKSQ